MYRNRLNKIYSMSNQRQKKKNKMDNLTVLRHFSNKNFQKVLLHSDKKVF